MRTFTILSACMFLLTAASIFSQTGKISYLEGDVTVKRESKVIFADFGMSLMEGDTLITGMDSLAILNLDKGGVVKLREDTILTLKGLGDKTSLKLNHGGVFAKVKKLAGWDFSISTKSVIAGVRGTEFFMAFGRKIDETNDVWLCVNEGTVNVSVPEKKQSVLVNQGEGINIIAGKKLTDPRYFKWTDGLNWNTDPALGDVKDVTDLNGAYSDLLDQDYE